MEAVEKQFKELVSHRLKQLELTPYALEKRADLPEDMVRNILRESYKRGPTISTVEKICDALDLAIKIGRYSDLNPAPETKVDGKTFVTVPRYDASAAAGGGMVKMDGPPIDHLAFSKTWLDQNGIQAGSCALINAWGHSMEPSIYDGDLIMIDSRKTQPRNRHIYVYHDPDHGTRVKRFELGEGVIAVHSDNPDKTQFPTEYHTGDDADRILGRIIGQVVWSGHKWV